MPYIEDIEVIYSNGTSWHADKALWTAGGNALEHDENGQAYYRLNLLKPADGADAGVFAPDASDDKAAYFRDAFDDYAEDDFADGAYRTPVVQQVRYTVDINRDQYTDDTQAEAAGVDFGTQAYSDLDTAAFAQFEVTGRFYKDDGRSASAANQRVTVDLNIGGEQGGNRHERAAVSRSKARPTNARRGRIRTSTTNKSYWANMTGHTAFDAVRRRGFRRQFRGQGRRELHAARRLRRRACHVRR